MTANHGAAAGGGLLPTATDGDLRLRYLEEVGALLWPAPARAEIGRRGQRPPDAEPPISEFILVPDAKRPRLLVPAVDRRAAATAVRRYAEPGSTRLRVILGLISVALATGLGGLIMRDRVLIGTGRGDRAPDTIETYLRRALGIDLVISLHVGPARANRKPVLQLLSRDGATVGFAKLGVNDLTRTLVRAERESLRQLGKVDMRHTTIPEVLHHGQWNDLEVLVQSPLPVWEPRAASTPDRLAASMREIAEVAGVTGEPLRDSPYWARLGERLYGLDEEPGAAALRGSYARIGSRLGAMPLRFGSWHGDLTPWNMATLRDTCLVWDWERFTRGVPLGFDSVHHAFQGAVVRGQDPQLAVTDCLERAAGLLAPFEVEERAARLTAVLYLIDIATRYLQDGQAEAGARLGALGQWLLPVLVDRVEKL